MKAEINGMGYLILFTIETVAQGQKKERREVTCYIIPKAESMEFSDAVVKSTARSHPGDPFHPTVGRKVALTRCLALLNASREDRTVIWKNFLKQYKQPKRRPSIGQVEKLQKQIANLQRQIHLSSPYLPHREAAAGYLNAMAGALTDDDGTTQVLSDGLLITSGQANPDPRTLSKSTGVNEGY